MNAVKRSFNKRRFTRRNAATKVSIRLCVPVWVKATIDRAAHLIGKSDGKFILDSARRCAEDVPMDQRFFMLNEKQYAAVLESLSDPSKPTAQLRKLLAGKSPWEKKRDYRHRSAQHPRQPLRRPAR
jgi:uncharacterized protein (DUF1778 family)